MNFEEENKSKRIRSKNHWWRFRESNFFVDKIPIVRVNIIEFLTSGRVNQKLTLNPEK